MSGTLVLVRHGQSEWNLKNLFTGWKDPGLTELGVKEAVAAGRKLKDRSVSKMHQAFETMMGSRTSRYEDVATKLPAGATALLRFRATFR